MAFELLDEASEMRPEYWARFTFPLVTGGVSIQADAVDRGTGILLAPLWDGNGNPCELGYRDASAYVAHRIDGSPSEPASEALIKSDIDDLLTIVTPFAVPTIEEAGGKVYVRTASIDNAYQCQMVLRAFQTVDNLIAGGLAVPSGFWSNAYYNAGGDTARVEIWLAGMDSTAILAALNAEFPA